jgi:type I restriction enzyme S subunit
MSGASLQLPEGWRWATLADLADVSGGLAKGKKRNSKARLRSVPYLRVANVQRGYIDLTEVKSIEATDQEVQDLRLEPGDVLLNEGGDRDKLGRGWVWKGQLAECIHQNHVFRARVRAQAILPELLSHYANSEGQRYFTAQGKQTTNLASISLGKLRGLPVPVPPPAQQAALLLMIDSHFSRLDAATTTLERVQRNLERYRASVLKAAVEGRLVPTEADLAKKEGRTFEPASVLLKRILTERRRRWEEAEVAKLKAKGKPPTDDRWKTCYEEPAAPDNDGLPELPEGWCWTTLEAIAEVKGGLAKGKHRRSGEKLAAVPYLRVANVQRGHLDLSEVKSIEATESELTDLALRSGDILFNEGGDRDKLGRGWIWRAELSVCIHQNHVFRARLLSPQVLPEFVSWHGNSNGQRYFFDEGKHTTNLASLSLSKLRGLPVPLPPHAEQLRIRTDVERLHSLASEAAAFSRTSQQRTARLRQSILKWAFEGRLVESSASKQGDGAAGFA